MKNLVLAGALAALVAHSASAACLEDFVKARDWNRTHGQVGEGIGVAAFGSAPGLWLVPPAAIGLTIAGAAVYVGSQLYIIRGDRIEKYVDLLLAARYDQDGRVVFDDAHRDLDPYYYEAVLDRFTYDVRQTAPGADRAAVVAKIREWDQSGLFCGKARNPHRLKRLRKKLAREMAGAGGHASPADDSSATGSSVSDPSAADSSDEAASDWN